MSENSNLNILDLIAKVGASAYMASDNGDGSADVEVTAAQASKLQELLGKESVQVVGLAGSHLMIAIKIEALQEAARKNVKARAGSVNVTIVSRIVYEVQTGENAINEVTGAWWSSEQLYGGIIVNGHEYEILPGLAKDYYDMPEDAEKAAEWQPERTVYVVSLPAAKPILLTSYGVTNLIRRVASCAERIGE